MRKKNFSGAEKFINIMEFGKVAGRWHKKVIGNQFGRILKTKRICWSSNFSLLLDLRFMDEYYWRIVNYVLGCSRVTPLTRLFSGLCDWHLGGIIFSGGATEKEKMPAGCQRSDFKYKPCCEFDFASKANPQQVLVRASAKRLAQIRKMKKYWNNNLEYRRNTLSCNMLENINNMERR